MKTPQLGDCLAVHYLEHSPVSVHPSDVLGVTGWCLEKVQQKLPEVRIMVIFDSSILGLIQWNHFLTINTS